MMRGLSETTCSEGFPLGLSKLSEPDMTTDIIHCNTALYAEPDATTSNFSIIATQDKPTVMASQLQRQMIALEQEEQMEVAQHEQRKGSSMYLFPTEKTVVAELENEECFSLSLSHDGVDVDESKKEEGRSKVEGQFEEAAVMLKCEEEEGAAESRTTVQDDAAESKEEENRVGAVDSQNEEDKEEDGVDSQPEEDGAVRSQSEEEEVAPDFQTEEEEESAADSQTEELGVDSQPQEEEDVTEYQSDREDSAEGGLADSQPEDEGDGEPDEEDGEEASEQLERDLEHISRRAHRSGGGVMAVTGAGEDLADATEAGEDVKKYNLSLWMYELYLTTIIEKSQQIF